MKSQNDIACLLYNNLQDIMNRQYLENFNNEQLQHYLKTLKRRISDLRQLTIELGKENEQLGVQYEALTKQKFEVYNSIQKKKKGWGKWLNKGKQKLTNIFHIGKKEEGKNEAREGINEMKIQEEPQNQMPQQNRSPQTVITKESPSKKITLQNFNFDDLYYIGKQKITSLFKKNKEGYHPSDKDNTEVQNGKREEGVRENVELIREITGEHPEDLKREESAEERQLRRRLLVEAEIAKKTNGSVHVQPQPQQIVEQNLTQKQVVVVATHEVHVVSQKQHQKQEVEQKQSNQAEHVQPEDQDHQFGVRYQSQMNEYQLKEQNVSQIVEKSAQKAPQSQEDIQEHSEKTESQPHVEQKQQESI